jgi:hypothetical protein
MFSGTFLRNLWKSGEECVIDISRKKMEQNIVTAEKCFQEYYRQRHHHLHSMILHMFLIGCRIRLYLLPPQFFADSVSINQTYPY